MGTETHPEHDRTSCNDEGMQNADAEGSTGCARCTALVLDRDSATREVLLEVAKYPELIHEQGAVNAMVRLLEIHNLIEKDEEHGR